jgi:hypothetical protein
MVSEFTDRLRSQKLVVVHFAASEYQLAQPRMPIKTGKEDRQMRLNHRKVSIIGLVLFKGYRGTSVERLS